MTDYFCLCYCLEGNVLLDLLIHKTEVRLLLDSRLALAKGIRMAAEGLLQLCHILFSCILFLIVGAFDSAECNNLLCSQGSCEVLREPDSWAF